jgi:hypothetical protein
MNILRITGGPFTQVIANTSVWHKQCTTRGKSGVAEREAVVWDQEVRRAHLLEDPAVRRTASHSQENIAEHHVECARS